MAFLTLEQFDSGFDLVFIEPPYLLVQFSPPSINLLFGELSNLFLLNNGFPYLILELVN